MAISPLSNNFQLTSSDRSATSSPNSGQAINSRNAVEAVVEPKKIAKADASTTKAQPDAQSLIELKAELDRFTESSPAIQRSLRFKIDDATGRNVISVVDRQTNETIRQIPPEELLTLSRRLKEINDARDSSSGVIIKAEA
ncbi:MAG: flagellar protein FlaG [Gammaproteobacteria bacterium]|nr:flagellar protein FlaG [Gammaproteobacteria bacterium]